MGYRYNFYIGQLEKRGKQRKTCKCGHNKKVHGYYYGCDRCGCQKFRPKAKGEE